MNCALHNLQVFWLYELKVIPPKPSPNSSHSKILKIFPPQRHWCIAKLLWIDKKRIHVGKKNSKKFCLYICSFPLSKTVPLGNRFLSIVFPFYSIFLQYLSFAYPHWLESKKNLLCSVLLYSLLNIFNKCNNKFISRAEDFVSCEK